MNDIIEKLDKDGILEVYPNVFIRTNRFETLFTGAETYDDLILIDNGKKGYKGFFDRLKDRGILN